MTGVVSISMRFSPVILREDAGAAFAEAVVADGVGVFPAAGAFMAGGLVDLNGEVFVGVALFGVDWCVCDVVEDELADDEEIFWRHIHITEGGFDVVEACAEVEGDFRIEGVTDLLILAGGFEWLHDFVAEVHKPVLRYGLPYASHKPLREAYVMHGYKLRGQYLLAFYKVAYICPCEAV